MKFNLNELNPGTWFDVGDGASICLRILNDADMSAIRAKTIERKAEYVGGQRYEHDVVNEKLAEELTWDAAIVDWKDIVDENDKPLACTKENKVVLMRGSVLFSAIVARRLNDLNRALITETEGVLKNSSTTQDGQFSE